MDENGSLLNAKQIFPTSTKEVSSNPDLQSLSIIEANLLKTTDRRILAIASTKAFFVWLFLFYLTEKKLILKYRTFSNRFMMKLAKNSYISMTLEKSIQTWQVSSNYSIKYERKKT